MATVLNFNCTNLLKAYAAHLCIACLHYICYQIDTSVTMSSHLLPLFLVWPTQEIAGKKNKKWMPRSVPSADKKWKKKYIDSISTDKHRNYLRYIVICPISRMWWRWKWMPRSLQYVLFPLPVGLHQYILFPLPVGLHQGTLQ